MTRPISYFVTTEIWLSLEDLYNAGLTAAECKTLIERMPDPARPQINLHCSPGGINGNWKVQSHAGSASMIEHTVSLIEGQLWSALQHKRAARTVPI